MRVDYAGKRVAIVAGKNTFSQVGVGPGMVRLEVTAVGLALLL